LKQVSRSLIQQSYATLANMVTALLPMTYQKLYAVLLPNERVP